MTIAQNLKALGPFFVGQFVGNVERELARPSDDMPARRWHVVQVRPQSERTIAEEIGGNGMGWYVPLEHGRIEVRTMRGRRWRDVTRPMFPGYVFAGFDPKGERWPTIAHIDGVVRLLMVDGHPLPLTESVIALVRNVEAELAEEGGRRRRKVLGMRLGDVVQIVEPLSFQGFLGPIVAIDGKARTVTVELEIFGRTTPLKLPPENVVVVGGA